MQRQGLVVLDRPGPLEDGPLAALVEPIFQWNDAIFLAIVVTLSFVTYVTRLGFYSDDWAHLGYLHTLGQQSFAYLLQADWSFDPTMWMRPVQLVYFVGTYALFGLQPLGYHLLNGLVLIGIAVALYAVLRELGQSRAVSLAVALVYILLPNYSSDRFWILAADGANIGVMFYLISVYASLRTGRCRSRWAWSGWLGLALISLLLSTLAYEITFLLSLLTPLLVAYRARSQRGAPAWPGARWAILGAATWLVLAAAAAYKIMTTARMVHEYQFWDQLSWFGETLVVETYLNFATFGLYLPRTAWQLWSGRPDWTAPIIAGLALLLVAGYLTHITIGAQDWLASRRAAIGLGLCGVVVYVLGYALFPFTNRELIVTSTGIGNRVTIAATGGVALLIASAIVVVCRLLPRVRLVFPALVAAMAAMALVMIDVLGDYWGQAATDQARLLDQLTAHLATPPPGAIILVDAACFYDGPAIVFDSAWDLRGALIARYGDPTLDANPLPPETQYSGVTVAPDGVVVRRGDSIDQYSYTNLYIYNASEQHVYRLVDATASARYFEDARKRETGCPIGVPGSGVRVI
jgi:hypothetical protein